MATIAVAMSFKNKSADTGRVNLVFNHYVGDKIMQFDSLEYKNELGQPFSVTKFKYYIGNIRLKSVHGNGFSTGKYYLINEEEP